MTPELNLQIETAATTYAQQAYGERLESIDTRKHGIFMDGAMFVMRNVLPQEMASLLAWYDKLSPAEKCTVWPPAGSGGGHGLYSMSNENIVYKYLTRKQ